MTSSELASRRWYAHFRRNRTAPDRLVHSDCYRLTLQERRAIERSIQQFQLGEGSKGKRLLARGFVHSRAVRDSYFLRALYLFIKEEQRHSAGLLHFMREQGIEPLRRQWVDSVFRFLRGLAGLELSLRVLVTAEIIAIPYYRALRKATNSPSLQALCSEILADEAAHVQFQASMLSRVKPQRSKSSYAFVCVAHRVFLVCTALVVWMGHRAVFAAAQYTLCTFLSTTWIQMNALADNVKREAQVRTVRSVRECRMRERGEALAGRPGETG